MADKNVQMPLPEEYFARLDEDAQKNDRVACRQATYLIKAYYDGRLQWSLPGLAVGEFVPVRDGTGVPCANVAERDGGSDCEGGAS